MDASDGIKWLKPLQHRQQCCLQLSSRLHVRIGLAFEGELAEAEVVNVGDWALCKRQHMPQRLGLGVRELERGLLCEA
eukprot:scaffold330265_cov62-Tisochrysis_lutea.AAC.1